MKTYEKLTLIHWHFMSILLFMAVKEYQVLFHIVSFKWFILYSSNWNMNSLMWTLEHDYLINTIIST